MVDPASILHEHDLVRTSSREGIIRAILDAGRPLSEQEIRDRIEGNYDRSTFYRSYKILEEKQIIHRIVIDHHIALYALDPMIAGNTNHAHFYCEKCNRVRCLEDHVVINPDLPDGFKAINTEMIIKGFCADCRKPKD
jgi:Fur family ferric uptake transcriptional regulator